MNAINSSLPSSFSWFLSGFCKAHRLYHGSQRIIAMTKNEQHAYLASMGFAVNFLAGNLPMVNIPAKTLLITKEAVSCIKKELKLSQAFKEFKRSFTVPRSTIHFFHDPNNFFKGSTKPHYFSSSSDFSHHLTFRIRLVWGNLQKLILSIFEYSFAQISLIQAFDPTYGGEAVEDVFLNIKEIMKDYFHYESRIKNVFENLELDSGINAKSYTHPAKSILFPKILKLFHLISSSFYNYADSHRNLQPLHEYYIAKPSKTLSKPLFSYSKQNLIT